MNQNLPNDPIVLLSVINTKLRDYYRNLDELCNDMKIEKKTLVERLSDIDYEYDAKVNRFV